MKLIGENVVLRTATQKDVDFIYDVMDEDSIKRNLNWKEGSAKNRIKAWLKENKKTRYNFIVCDKSSNRVGTINLFGINKPKGSATIGWLAVSDKSTRKGYATDAIKTIMKFAFDKLKLKHLRVLSKNPVMKKVAKKAGLDSIFHFRINKERWEKCQQ